MGHTCAVQADATLAYFGHNRDEQCDVPAGLGLLTAVLFDNASWREDSALRGLLLGEIHGSASTLHRQCALTLAALGKSLSFSREA